MDDDHQAAVNFAEHGQGSFNFVAVADQAQASVVDEEHIPLAGRGRRRKRNFSRAYFDVRRGQNARGVSEVESLRVDQEYAGVASSPRGYFTDCDHACSLLYRQLPAASGYCLDEGESTPLMSPPPGELTARIRRLVEVLDETGLIRLRITDRDDNSVELRRALRPPTRALGDSHSTNGTVEAPPKRPADVIKSDLVGIAHFGRPAPAEGATIEGDRELAYVEALGIRNPVRSHGSGRIAGVLVRDGQAVEYGQPLFEIDRA